MIVIGNAPTMIAKLGQEHPQIDHAHERNADPEAQSAAHIGHQLKRAHLRNLRDQQTREVRHEKLHLGGAVEGRSQGHRPLRAQHQRAKFARATLPSTLLATRPIKLACQRWVIE